MSPMEEVSSVQNASRPIPKAPRKSSRLARNSTARASRMSPGRKSTGPTYSRAREAPRTTRVVNRSRRSAR